MDENLEKHEAPVDDGSTVAILNRELKNDDRFDLASAWEGAPQPDPVDLQEDAPTQKDQEQGGEPELGQAAGGQSGSETTSPTPLTPPAHFNAAEKKLFSGLDQKSQELVRNVVRRTDQEVSRYRTDLQRRAQEYESLDQVLGPRQQQFAQEGLTPAQGVAQLLQISDYASNDPEGFIQWFSQQRGISLEDVLLGQIDKPEVDPKYQSLQQELGLLKNQLTEQQQRDQHIKLTSVRNELDSFRSATDEQGNAKYPYMDHLEKRMAGFIRAGHADTLEDAYEQAAYSDPTVRQALLEDRNATDLKQRTEQDRMKAQRARRAAKSLDGGLGASTSAAPVSLRDSLEQKFNAY